MSGSSSSTPQGGEGSFPSPLSMCLSHMQRSIPKSFYREGCRLDDLCKVNMPSLRQQSSRWTRWGRQCTGQIWYGNASVAKIFMVQISRDEDIDMIPQLISLFRDVGRRLGLAPLALGSASSHFSYDSYWTLFCCKSTKVCSLPHHRWGLFCWCQVKMKLHCSTHSQHSLSTDASWPIGLFHTFVQSCKEYFLLRKTHPDWSHVHVIIIVYLLGPKM